MIGNILFPRTCGNFHPEASSTIVGQKKKKTSHTSESWSTDLSGDISSVSEYCASKKDCFWSRLKDFGTSVNRSDSLRNKTGSFYNGNCRANPFQKETSSYFEFVYRPWSQGLKTRICKFFLGCCSSWSWSIRFPYTQQLETFVFIWMLLLPILFWSCMSWVVGLVAFICGVTLHAVRRTRRCFTGGWIHGWIRSSSCISTVWFILSPYFTT